MKTLVLEGRLASGEGNGKRYLQLPWVMRQMEEKLGYSPFLGTLNLKLTKVSAMRKKHLSQAQAERVCPIEGYCVGLLHKAFIRGCLDCAIVLPQVEDYAENLLEVIAPMNLREALKLKDGDLVRVYVVQ